jgi:uncharacterized membrane protein YphA (DoxX/SURF4 family)
MTLEAGAARRINWLNIGLWVAQVLLAVAYVMAGSMKLSQPMTGLAAMGMGYATQLPELFVRFVGLMEVLGAIGLIAPAATRILPFLTPLAAAGLAFVQVSAIVLHATRGETAMTLPVNLVLLALALFVLWGRTQKAAISPR